MKQLDDSRAYFYSTLFNSAAILEASSVLVGQMELATSDLVSQSSLAAASSLRERYKLTAPTRMEED
jgi:hypothetical protein